MNKLDLSLRWLAVVWLALAPVLAAAHQADHADGLLGEELSCTLCHAFDRDDDGVPPEAELRRAPLPLAGRDVPAEQGAAHLAPRATHPIRGPPVSATA